MTDIDDLSLRRDLRGLRVDIRPTANLWPGIEGRIIAARHQHRGRRRTRLAWLGSMAAGLFVVLGLIGLPGLDRPSTVSPDGGDAITEVTPADAADTVLDAYAHILATEQTQAAQRQHRLSRPGGRDRQAAARELDVSLANMAAALRLDPHSQLLRRLMHQTLQQRAALALDA